LKLNNKLQHILSKLKQTPIINKQLVDSLYELSINSQISSLVFSILVTIFLYPVLKNYIAIWGIGLFTYTLFRLYTIYIFKSDSQKYSLLTWYRLFAITSLLTATILSLLGTVYIHYLNEFYQLFVIAVLVASASVSTTSLSSDFRIAIAYISIILIPLIVSIAVVQITSHYILCLLLILLFTAHISMIFNSYRKSEKIKKLFQEVRQQTKYNENLLQDNKQFIADMVHQIRTPLSVIMTNSSLIEMKTNEQVSSYITQINSAINMLSNSYEDLSYIITNDTIEYRAKKINLSDFLHERINFFEVIADANAKIISTDIANDLHITMNDTELERLIDNNLSNAIKHSHDKSVIKIILEKIHSQIILQFISEGESIKEISKLFDKNYTESNSAKRSLGLGLNMVKIICEKNDIYYNANSENNLNTFTYIFKA